MSFVPYRVISWSSTVRRGGIAIHGSMSNRLVAVASYSARTKTGATSNMSARVDIEHGGLARYLVDYLLTTIGGLSDGQRVRLVVPGWQEPVIEAARTCGCGARLELHRLAKSLE
jgi:hypothetical protein